MHPNTKRLLQFLLLLVLVLGLGSLYSIYFLRGEAIYQMEDRYFRPLDDHKALQTGGMSAEACGSCHAEIYKEWQVSMHAGAYKDPYFQAYWAHDEQNITCRWCHTPLASQWPELPTTLPNSTRSLDGLRTETNPRFDQKLQHEGVTCVACHLRDGLIQGPWRANELTAPHAVTQNTEMLSYRFCGSCHEVKEDKYQFYRNSVCGSMDDFAASAHAQEGFNCQTCHMPAITRPLVQGFPARASRRHLWTGGNSPQMLRFALGVTVEVGTQNAHIVVRNHRAGHHVPSGDPDRRLRIVLEAIGGDGKVVASKDWLLGRTLLWWPLIVELADERIAPRSNVVFDLAYSKAVTGVMARVEYQIVSARQHKGLVEKYQLPASTPRKYTVFESFVDVGQKVEQFDPNLTPQLDGKVQQLWLHLPYIDFSANKLSR